MNIPASKMNHRPKPISVSQPTLADILQDPDTKWSDIREAMKTRGRGSFHVGKQGTFLKATTNAGIVKALRESVGASEFKGDCDVDRLDDCADDNDDDDNDEFSKETLFHYLAIEAGKANDGEAPRKIMTDTINDMNIKGVSFTDSIEQTKIGESRWCNIFCLFCLLSIIMARSKTHGEGNKKADDSRIEADNLGTTLCAPPLRRLTRGSSCLKNVLEDVEADMDDFDICIEAGVDGVADLEESRPVEMAGETSQSLPLATFTLTRGFSSSRRSSLESFGQLKSNSSISSASVNLMDFGVDHNRRQSLTSLGAWSNMSTGTVLSKLVDSDGFLGWGDNDDSSSSSSSTRSDNCRSVPEQKPMKRSESFRTDSSSSLSNLVDSMGFLGWGESQTGDDGRAIDRTASRKSTTTTEVGNNSQKVSEDHRKKEPPKKVVECWRIEDFDDPNNKFELPDEIKLSNSEKSGSKNILSYRVKRLMNKTRRNASFNASFTSTNSNAAKELIKMDDDIKRVLLAGRPSGTDEPSPKFSGRRRREHAASDGALRSSYFASFFTRMGSDLDTSSSDREDSRTAFQINREDDVDIGELRRGLHGTGGSKENNNHAKGRRKIGFFNREY
mmetsp:Transcript_26312/g.47711  ORF Transcript_26312/g.47711 Transcript_26312/m.47711 type:complete len:616 (+) Transcript_26312:61-1908(+)|eukprot:CAMPEP_0201626474 /NCGR_PEP_ID=MMETSP0493-20130528/1843_1 /ASSEMBLY_ACC=CAM_ASM_000838 /TAXON_ID=420259 /ORGANISM="Thalassiosira gravida, Strain GMp14c1" /LENGTH=615 /DNA_ID=CAMNT_0048096569 /DNA_START=49 /DNA_END=1896 /DNA_ORIENTATION=-